MKVSLAEKPFSMSVKSSKPKPYYPTIRVEKGKSDDKYGDVGATGKALVEFKVKSEEEGSCTLELHSIDFGSSNKPPQRKQSPLEKAGY